MMPVASAPRDAWPTNQEVPIGYEKLSTFCQREGRDNTLRALQGGNVTALELCGDDGRLTPVAVEHWRVANLADDMLTSGYKSFYAVPNDPDHHPGYPIPIYSYGSDWRLLVVALTSSAPVVRAAPKPSPGKAGGRPSTYDWAAAAGYLAGHVAENDYPSTQAELQRTLQQWFEKQGKVPDDSDLKRFIREMYKLRRC